MAFTSHQYSIVIWLVLGAILLVSATSAVVALQRRQPVCVFASVLLLNVTGSIVWAVWGSGTVASLIQANVVCLAIGSILWMLPDAVCPAVVPHLSFNGRPVVCAHLAAELAVGLLGLVAAIAVGGAVLSLPHLAPQPLDWIALAVTSVAVAVSFWDRNARFSLAGLYWLALTAVSMGELQRGYWPGNFFLWGTICEWAGLMIVAALVGWLFRRFRFAATVLRIPGDRTYWPGGWFNVAQALLAAVVVVLVTWISVDSSFDSMGTDVALFGLSGRMSSCPAALMLVGAAMLMAWQTDGAWRAAWQYAAMAAGVLFTTSVGWARLDAGSATADALWLDRSVNLMISTAMMTLLTRFGLARVLPHSGDWITRARRAAPVFGGLALLLLVAVLAQKALSS